ncbi:hypothetical protein AXG93_3437s1090 [Marchantia polymorpha subsp. ruderalis]|uniref:Uncharacterized protein n=1 Tax=Marchantia polymorpha subsp. ruderalis TaxID=1480154 RepID=A0A176W0L6_MARPO|nr:hypothetical protein AXG93_3437s1090 [Marchantia polymorpha subsp. ruderalis]
MATALVVWASFASAADSRAPLSRSSIFCSSLSVVLLSDRARHSDNSLPIVVGRTDETRRAAAVGARARALRIDPAVRVLELRDSSLPITRDEARRGGSKHEWRKMPSSSSSSGSRRSKSHSTSASERSSSSSRGGRSESYMAQQQGDSSEREQQRGPLSSAQQLLEELGSWKQQQQQQQH